MKIKQSNPEYERVKNAVNPNLTDKIIDKLIEMDYDEDDSYNHMYWFAKGFNAKREDDEYFKKFDRNRFIVNDPLDKFKRKNAKDKFEKDRKNEKIKREDDTYFKNLNRDEFKVKDPLDELMRMDVHDKFENDRKHERQAITVKENYKRMFDDLRKPLPKLNPIPSDWKPYSQILFEKENQELLEYFEKHGHEFENIDTENLMVNQPHDEQKALAVLEETRRKYPNDFEIVEKIIEKDKDPIIGYYLNKIHKLEDIFRFLENVVYENEYIPFKLTFEIGGIFDIPDKNISPESDPEFKYEPRPVTITK
ncbi:hypothetical protein M9Y10_018849 [Tritrichomonas musculus]|uniref:Uncharacterized protein n=1 Tax=Tritrichomonas musculus TaxID=1915356 RepID=A0ABR2HK05_9EUKA